MSDKGVNVELLVQSGISISDCVDSMIVATDYGQLINSANGGDRAAAKELLALASGYLVSDIFGPMPPELRRYLGMALASVAIGKSADVALNLKKIKGGGPKRSRRRELQVANLIRKQMQSGVRLEQASFDLAEDISAGLQQYKTFYGFKKKPDAKTLEGIYTKMIPYLDTLEAYVTSKTPLGS